MDIRSLILSKKHADAVALGIGKMRVEGDTVYFTIASTGEEVSVKLPTPKDGDSVIDVKVINGDLICTFESGKEINAGRIPFSAVDGVSTYNELPDKPTVNGHILEGDLSSQDLGIVGKKTEGVDYGELGIGQEGAEVFNDIVNNKAIGMLSHAEGGITIASGNGSHAEGGVTIAIGYVSHAEGIGTIASGDGSHAEGGVTIASGDGQHVQGRYNIEDTTSKYAHIVGNGNGTKDDPNENSNAHTLDWQGNSWYQGDVLCGGTSMDDPEAISLKEVASKISDKEIILNSSTPESTKKFKITVDDTGTIKAEEVV